MTGGFLNVLKPPGMSSHDVISAVRRIFHVKRAGHAGTLDPAAAGVLPVALGQACRLLEYLEEAGKSYRAEILFGRATDSGDDTGEILAEQEVFRLPETEAMENLLKSFVGNIKQRLPAYSAVKIDGKRAYARVRGGETVERPVRRAHIDAIRLLERKERSIRIDVDCAKGTYIRSLAEAIGESAGIPSAMGFLLRTRVGAFSIARAKTLEELSKEREKALLPPEPFLEHLPRYELPGERARAFQSGLPTGNRAWEGEGIHTVYSAGKFLGIGSFSQKEAALFPVKVFPREAGQ